MQFVGPLAATMTIDAETHRTYKVTYRVSTDDPNDGPLTISNCPGLPQPGTSYGPPWNIDNRFDTIAICQPEITVRPASDMKSGEPYQYFEVDKTFTTKGNGNEPYELSFSGSKEKQEAVTDLFGFFIKNSAHEPITGAQVEFDISQPIIKLKQYFPDFFTAVVLPNLFANCVNATPLWGFPPRTLKLMSPTGDRKWMPSSSLEARLGGYGQAYYVRTLEFEVKCRVQIRPDVNNTGTLADTSQLVVENWDRQLADEGSKVLQGRFQVGTNGARKWVLTPISTNPLVMPDPSNPQHFIKYTDPSASGGRVLLDGAGKPAGADISDPNKYICIRAVRLVGPTTTIALTNVQYWLAQGSLIGGQWDATQQYQLGDSVNIVNDEDEAIGLYISLAPNINVPPVQEAMYVCITPNSGQAVTNAEFWLVLPTPLNLDTPGWDNTVAYVPGKFVSIPEDPTAVYVCLVANTSVNPFNHATKWQILPNGIEMAGAWNNTDNYGFGEIVSVANSSWLLLPDGIVDAGMWYNTSAYSVGQRVFSPFANRKSNVGSIFVAKYPGVEFRQLNIPETF